MLEIIKAVALLCAVHASGQYGSASNVDAVQRDCQAEMVYCITKEVEKDKLTAESALATCVVGRAIDNGWRPKKI